MLNNEDKLALRAVAVAAIILLGGLGLALFEDQLASTPIVVEQSSPLPSAPPPVVKKDRFPLVMERVLVHEGGATYTNHPADPGGPTKWGITIWDVRKYIKTNATASDVKTLTKAQALSIYHVYWKALHADELPVGVDYVVVDYGINAGISRSGKTLRRVAGFPDAMGEVSADVLAAIAKDDPRSLIGLISAERMKFQMGLPSRYNVFKKGWKRRIQEVESQAYADLTPLAKGIFDTQITVQPAPGKTPSYLEDLR